MKPVIVAACAATLLAACQTTQPAPGPVPVTAPTDLDAKIARVSQTLAKQCVMLGIAIAGAQIYASSPKVDDALMAAEDARQRFCAHPPTNTSEAIQTVADMAIAVQAALNEGTAQ